MSQVDRNDGKIALSYSSNSFRIHRFLHPEIINCSSKTSKRDMAPIDYRRNRIVFERLDKSFYVLCFNMFSFELHTLLSTFPNCFYPFQTIKFVEVVKIGSCLLDDFMVGVKPLSAEPFLQVWKQQIVIEAKT